VGKLVLQAAQTNDGSCQLSLVAFFLVVFLAAAANALPACAWRVDIVLRNIATVGTRDNRGANGHSAQRGREELEIHDDGVEDDAGRYKSDHDDRDLQSGNLSVKRKGAVNGDESYSPHLPRYPFLPATDINPFAKLEKHKEE
jgi:hypothetical protein